MAITRRKKRQPARWKRWKYADGSEDGSLQLVGDWAHRIKPPSFAHNEAPPIWIEGDFFDPALESLKLIPMTRKLSIHNYGIMDFSGIHALPKLECLFLQGRSNRSRLNLDFSKLPNLKRLYLEWDGSISNQGCLKKLTHLTIRGCTGVKHLDLSGLRSLEHLRIGPARGVEKVSLDGIPKLKELALTSMQRLAQIEGDRFYSTVTRLDVSGTMNIPESVPASFTALELAIVGTRRYKFTKKSFRKCSPAVVALPI